MEVLEASCNYRFIKSKLEEAVREIHHKWNDARANGDHDYNRLSHEESGALFTLNLLAEKFGIKLNTSR